MSTRASVLITFRLTPDEARLLRAYQRGRDDSLHLVARDLLAQRLRNRELEDLRCELDEQRALLDELRQALVTFTKVLTDFEGRLK